MGNLVFVRSVGEGLNVAVNGGPHGERPPQLVFSGGVAGIAVERFESGEALTLVREIADWYPDVVEQVAKELAAALDAERYEHAASGATPAAVKLLREADGTYSLIGPDGCRYKSGDEAAAQEIMDRLLDKLLAQPERACTCGARHRCDDDPLVCGMEVDCGE